MPMTLADLAELSKAGRTGNAPVYDDAYLRRQSTQGLDRSADYGRGQHVDPSTDEKDYPMAEAKKFLRDTSGTQTQLNLAGQVGRDSVAPHQPSMPERQAGAIASGGRAAASVGAFMAPEVAIPADMLLGMDSATSLAHEGMAGVKEHPVRSALEALAALSGVSRLAGAAGKMPGKFPAMVRGGEDLAGTEQAYKAAQSIPDVAHMYDAEKLGVEAGEPAIKVATRDKSSRAALRQLKASGKPFGGDPNFNGGMGDPELAGSHVPGHTSGLDSDIPESFGPMADKYANGRSANTGSHPTTPRSKNPYGRYAMHQPSATGGDPTPMFNVTGGEHHGSTLSAAELLKHGIQIDGGIPPYDEAAIKAARDAAMARMMGTLQEK